MTPLKQLEAICDEIFEHWDKDMRPGKLLIALAGELPKYRADVSAVRSALAASAAAHDVLAERKRQQEVEGWTPEHDDGHKKGELADAAAAYALGALRLPASSATGNCREIGFRIWPWLDDWWKPTTRRRDLVKAAALIIAEIERLDRSACAAAPLPERRP